MRAPAAAVRLQRPDRAEQQLIRDWHRRLVLVGLLVYRRQAPAEVCRVLGELLEKDHVSVDPFSMWENFLEHSCRILIKDVFVLYVKIYTGAAAPRYLSLYIYIY